MTLEHGLDPVSARWDKINNRWDIGQRKKYRWCDTLTDEPISDWLYDITDVINYARDQEKNIT